MSRIGASLVSGVWALSLFVTMFGAALYVPVVWGSGTIYIRTDGSIDPPTAPIMSADNVIYTFTDNIYDSIVVERSNIIVDGNGYTLQGPGVNGFALTEMRNVTIENVDIKGFQTALYLNRSHEIKITENNMTANYYSVTLLNSSNNELSANNIGDNEYGIYLEYSLNNIISGNSIRSSVYYGIRLDKSSRNTLRNNKMTESKFNFYIDGISLTDFVNDVDASNTVDDKPIYYWVSARNGAVPSDAGCVILVNCTSITAQNLNLTKNEQGVLLAYTMNTTVAKSNIADNGLGIDIWHSSNNTISLNNITNNQAFGILLTSSSRNTIFGNNIARNEYSGVRLYSSSSGNTITANNIIDNDEGFTLSSSPNNFIYHNNLINNVYQVDAYNSTNILDNGYPSGGNYWSNYNGVDANGDGIGDTAYVFGANNRDRYPLMSPWTPPQHELVVSITALTSITLGSSSSINAIVMNQGLNDEASVELLLLINGTLADSISIPFLQSGNSYTLSYLWTPTVKGTYNATAYVPPLTGEANTQNNQATEFVTVYSSLPPVASFTYSPTAPIAGETVTFDASSSYDSDGSIISYGWEFGDGTAGSGKIVTHNYANAGIHNVTLTVTDSEGATDTETSTLTISTAPKVGVKAGDWIKLDYAITSAPSGTPLPQWIKIEFLSVDGTTANIRVTMHMSDGTEPSQTMTVDVAVGSGAFQGLSGFVIPANCTTGDSVYISGYGNVTIAGETIRTYAGASRTVVHASFSQYGTQLTYYWDKQTGVMVEASTISGGITGTAKTTETNMWQAQPSGLAFNQIYLYVLAAVVVVIVAGSVAFIMRRNKKNTETVTPNAPTLQTTY